LKRSHTFTVDFVLYVHSHLPIFFTLADKNHIIISKRNQLS